jgi:Domain of unknown function (DUF4386)
MSAAVVMKRIAEASPRIKARIAGAVYLLSVLIASFSEIFARGTLNIVGGLIAILGMAVMTLLLHGVFKSVNKSLSLLAAFSSLVGLTLEVFRFQPRGVNVAIVFSGIYCLLIGYLIFSSTFLPRTLGVVMAYAGLGWLTYLSTPLANYLSPYNLISGLLGEGLVMLWLLVIGLNAQKWNELTTAQRMRSP